MKQRINVTQEDIDETRQGDPQACMVWRAVTRNLQLESQTGASPVSVHVDYRNVTLVGKKGQVQVPLSTQTNGKIRKFDEDKSLVSPFDFTLNLPDDWREQIGQIPAPEGGSK